MALFSGLDTRTVLPPFFPQFRGEDTIFGKLVRICHPSALIGYLPYGALHDSDRPALYEHFSWPYSGHPSLSTLLLCILGGYPVRGSEEAAQRYLSVGSYLDVISCLPSAEFAEVIAELFVERQARELEFLESRRTSSVLTRAERREIDRYSTAVLQGMRNKDYLAPAEFAHSGFSAAIDSFRSLAQQYASLLMHWPEIWDAAESLGDALGTTTGN